MKPGLMHGQSFYLQQTIKLVEAIYVLYCRQSKEGAEDSAIRVLIMTTAGLF